MTPVHANLFLALNPLPMPERYDITEVWEHVFARLGLPVTKGSMVVRVNFPGNEYSSHSAPVVFWEDHVWCRQTHLWEPDMQAAQTRFEAQAHQWVTKARLAKATITRELVTVTPRPAQEEALSHALDPEVKKQLVQWADAMVAHLLRAPFEEALPGVAFPEASRPRL